MFEPYDEEEMETMTEEDRVVAEWINEWLEWMEEIEDMRYNEESPSAIYNKIMIGVIADTDRAVKYFKELGMGSMIQTLDSFKDAGEKDHNM